MNEYVSLYGPCSKFLFPQVSTSKWANARQWPRMPEPNPAGSPARPGRGTGDGAGMFSIVRVLSVQYQSTKTQPAHRNNGSHTLVVLKTNENLAGSRLKYCTTKQWKSSWLMGRNVSCNKFSYYKASRTQLADGNVGSSS